ncbi:MAG: hypothetical protein HYU80_03690 [Candidatus Blackburnbacteria bacterium]|nr:hypothetical protein [Candidatus Blackburnbacteria bacterium]
MTNGVLEIIVVLVITNILALLFWLHTRNKLRYYISSHEKKLAQNLGKLERDIDIQKASRESRRIISRAVEQAQGIVEEGKKTSSQLDNFLKDIKKSLPELLETRLNTATAELDKELSRAVGQVYKTGTAEVQEELRRAREAVREYEIQRRAAVDENIVEMVEGTAAAVLGKKLSLKENMEMVYEALEKVKIKNTEH